MKIILFLKVQCVLSINLFNEKIFIFIWFWLCLVSIFNIFDLISWTYTLIINSNERYNYVKKRLYNIKRSDDIEDKQLFRKFVNSYLREDGVLALRILSRNSQDLIVSEAVANLYNSFKVQYKQKHLRQKHLKINLATINDEWAEANKLSEHTQSTKTNENCMLPPQNVSKFINVKET